ncbi:uncharacterized protein V1518DRAFT_76884 [Limtongia smithiae]|uniref:uncharacterized protein n=1 Tax=Limtongia smithiae TaxID=1125753 RepID=UPI0034D0076D
MVSILSMLSTKAPYHLFGYSLLFGATVYQSFFVGIMAFRALPRQHFAALQRKIFPPYFAMQAALPVFLALTTPVPGALAGVTTTVVSLVITAVTGLVNYAAIGPMTVNLMNARKAQETKEGKKYYDEGVSDEMRALNKRFGAIHGISTLINLGTLFAIAAYGVVLTEGMVAGFAA